MSDGTAGTADVIIIGGGMAGAGAAARLAPHASVVVLEAEDAPGYHATGRSAAAFLLNYGNATIQALTAASEATLADPDPALAEGSLLVRRGEMIVAAPGEEEALASHMAAAPALAPLDPGDAVRMFPILRREMVVAAAFEASARDIDVDRLLQGFLRIARVHGAQVVCRARTGALARRDGAWRVDTAAGVFEAPVVINAAGAWAGAVGRLAGATAVPLTPMRRSAAIIPAPGGHDVTGWPLIANATETWYARPDAGRLMVSPADEDPCDPMDAWADDMVIAEGLARYEAMVTEPVTRVDRTWAGLRTFAPDRTPVAGFDQAAEGFFWLAGQGGYGIQTAPALSALAAHLVAGAPRPDGVGDEVIAALCPTRFAA
ncbi:FAD-binding oxidoreductase [Limibaculum sp. M0105]|uniref:FAD-binding oxidoreductase n=1 Tax=Thermohalobaculum xanthum TaxID=2753746 RepID=A0A8J7SCE9_9RHOB|nr:FAD-binding oxidoreductase [Thermohalobaculum xanthum]MBK0397842.1 FAD-binding oxidoreductase [Thermohalobaculum xanthum]